MEEAAVIAVRTHESPRSEPGRPDPGPAALRLSASFWFFVTLIGQWLFAYYVSHAYGGPVVRLDFQAVNETQKITGFVEGDAVGNVFMLTHVLFGAVVSFGGLLQLVPQLRRHAPGVHRWTGRLFLSVSLVAAASGLWLTWGRGSRLSDVGALGVTLNGILILVAAPIAWRRARAGDLGAHRRWAIRTFLLVSGVWTFRLGLFGWLMANQGPLGNTSKLDGPVDQLMSYGSYLVPLAIAELYFWAQRRAGTGAQLLVAGTLGVLSLAMAFGIFAAFMISWRPHL